MLSLFRIKTIRDKQLFHYNVISEETEQTLEFEREQLNIVENSNLRRK